MCKISIIVPIYNVEKYLNRCIDSILAQTFTDFELILVDDGSTDNCIKICNEYAEKDNRIVVIHKENSGLSAARNTGLDIATGEYIGFIDSDDYIHPQMYEILYSKIIKSNCDLAISRFKKIYNNEDEFKEYNIDSIKYYKLNSKEALNELCGNNSVQFVIACNKLYKKNLFDKLRYEDGRYHEDEFIIHNLLYKCRDIVYIELDLYNYYQREGSIMKNNSPKRIIDSLDAYESRMKFFYKNKMNNLTDYIAYFYVIKFFNEYKKEFIINNNYNKKMKRSFLNNIIFLLNSSKFNIKEKLSFIIFLLSEKLYYKYIN